MEYFLEALQKYMVFLGRSRRKEYWFFVLFNFLISLVLTIVDGMIGTYNPMTGMGFLSGLFGLAMFIPGLSVSVRRLHDTDRSGWWLLIAFLPILGWLILLVFMILDGTPGPNRFGESPKAVAA